jgi:acetyl-CoA carboxylase alpha subunit
VFAIFTATATGDDKAIITAMGQIGREKVMIIGHNKGRDIKEKLPAISAANGRLSQGPGQDEAGKFGLPIVT